VARRRSPLPILGELEEAVLEHLWRSGEADVFEAYAAVGARRHIRPNTVGSALERLHRKSLAVREKVSHAYRYRPAISRDAFYARRAVDAAGGVRALASRGLLVAFVDLVADADARTLDQLEAAISRRREEEKA
jgi:predicted transcriptional regulator